MLEFCALASGSGGNAVLVYTAKSCLLVDAGISAKRICGGMASLGLDPASLDGILITHTHSDHISGLRVLLRRCGAPLYASAPAAEILSREVEGAAGRIHSVAPQQPFSVGELNVSVFPTPHDAPGSLGCTVSAGGRKCAVVTDLGRVTDEVRRCVLGAHLALVETNHDVDWLENGPYSPGLKSRIRGDGGHLSNEDGGALCCELAEHGANSLVLGHLSAENNSPELALRTVRALLAQRGLSPALAVASRSEPCGPFEV